MNIAAQAFPRRQRYIGEGKDKGSYNALRYTSRAIVLDRFIALLDIGAPYTKNKVLRASLPCRFVYVGAV